jgi:hypothetical protein
MVPSALSNVAGFGALLRGRTLAAKLSDPDMRAEVYSEAILSAIAADELGRLEPEAARGIGGNENLESFARAGGQTSNVVGATADITRGVRAIEAVNRARRMGSNVNSAQAAAAARFQSSPLGKASTDLAVLSLAVNLATDFNDEADRAAFLGEAIRDARIIGALKDLEAVLQVIDHDPAMLQGIVDARTRLTELSNDRLERMASAGAAAFDSNKATIAAFALTSVASGGASLVAREVMELGVSVDDFTAETISIAAMHNIAAASLAPIRMLAEGDMSSLDGLSPEEIDVTQLGAFNARLAAEANAATYTLLWTDRWDNPTSVAGLGKALGMSMSEGLGAGNHLKERYRRLVATRAETQAALWDAALTLPNDPNFSVENENDRSSLRNFTDLEASSRTTGYTDPGAENWYRVDFGQDNPKRIRIFALEGDELTDDRIGYEVVDEKYGSTKSGTLDYSLDEGFPRSFLLSGVSDSYLINITAINAYSGFSLLTGNDPFPDVDAGDSFAQASTIDVNTTRDESFGFYDDEYDYFWVTAPEDGELTVLLTKMKADLDLKVFNADQVEISSSANFGIGNEETVISVERGEVYFILVSSSRPSQSVYTIITELESAAE